MDAYKHGVFFHHVLEALRGKYPKALNDRDEVTWDGLELVVRDKVSDDVEARVGDGARQTPALNAGELSGRPPVLLKPATTTKPADPRSDPSAEADFQKGENFAAGRGATKDDGQALEWYKKAAAKGHAKAATAAGEMLRHGRGATQDMKQAFEWYKRAADAGEPVGMYWVGRYYTHGHGGVAKDAAEATRWTAEAVKALPPAAAAGDALAAYFLGVCCDHAIGLPRDPIRAVDNYKRAAERGHALAAADAGRKYELGDGPVAKNEEESVKWYKLASEFGDTHSTFKLGTMSELGRGVPHDDAKAAEYYRKAADRGSFFAMYALGLLVEAGRGVPRDDKQAAEWFKKSAERNYPRAKVNLGLLTASGRGVPRDEKGAVELYKQAAAAGDGVGSYWLAFATLGGHGVAKDDKEAERLFAEAAKNLRQAADRDGPAALKLSMMYGSGRGGLAKDEKQAVEWLRKAADLGEAMAMFSLARKCDLGTPAVAKDEKEAGKWYRKGAEYGYPPALFHWAEIQEAGRGGVPKDEKLAAEWYRKAADKGYVQAMVALGTMLQAGRGVPRTRSRRPTGTARRPTRIIRRG